MCMNKLIIKYAINNLLNFKRYFLIQQIVHCLIYKCDKKMYIIKIKLLKIVLYFVN